MVYLQPRVSLTLRALSRMANSYLVLLLGQFVLLQQLALLQFLLQASLVLLRLLQVALGLVPCIGRPFLLFT